MQSLGSLFRTFRRASPRDAIKLRETMDLLNNPLLRRTLAPQPAPDPHSEPRKRLLDALLWIARSFAGN